MKEEITLVASRVVRIKKLRGEKELLFTELESGFVYLELLVLLTSKNRNSLGQKTVRFKLKCKLSVYKH